MVIATKGRFAMGENKNDLGLSRRHLRQALDASLQRLQVDHIDLYQVHSFDPLTPLDETWGFLDDAVRAGKISYVGLSNYVGWQIQKVVDLADFRGLPRPVTLQPQYNLLAREIEWEVIPACESTGLGLLPWSPLGGGWLTGKYTKRRAPDRRHPARRRPQPRRRGLRPPLGRAAHVGRDRRRAGDRERPRRLDGAGRARVAARPPADDVGDPRRADAWSSSNDNLGAAGLHLTAEETTRLDEASDPARRVATRTATSASTSATARCLT